MFLGTAAKHFLQAFGRLVTSEGLSHICFSCPFPALQMEGHTCWGIHLTGPFLESPGSS